MKKLTIILASALLLAAVAAVAAGPPHKKIPGHELPENKNVANTCKGKVPPSIPGITPVNVIYGYSQLKVTPYFAQVNEGKALRFNLINVSGPTKEVTINSEGVKCAWLNNKSSKTFDACQNDKSEVGFVCQYTVEVPGVGKLDPYAKIIP